jgi:hypothetical protein
MTLDDFGFKPSRREQSHANFLKFILALSAFRTQAGLIIVSFSIYLSKKNTTCDYTIRGRPSDLFFFTSHSTACALQRTELHTGTFIACANCS